MTLRLKRILITQVLEIHTRKRNQIDLRNNLEGIAFAIKDFSIVILKSITTLSSQFIFFVIITIFSLYYFYVDGPSFIDKVRRVSPLDNKINDLILNQFSGLSLNSCRQRLFNFNHSRSSFCNRGNDCWITGLIFWSCNGSSKLYSDTRRSPSLASVVDLLICNRGIGKRILFLP